MTEMEEAQQRAEDAYQRASNLRKKGDSIAEAWRKSQVDNNFRQMLRELAGRGATRDGTA